MIHPLMTQELISTIQEDRRLQAEARRERSLSLLRGPRTDQETMRMALGPGIQFAGVTERVLDMVTGRRPGRAVV